MNYWERWVGDWKRKTAHLSAEQKGLYGELLDHQYATELPLPADHESVYRLAGARTASETRNVDQILREFFVLGEHGYENPRAIEEITKRLQYVNEQRQRANRRWNPPAATQSDVPTKSTRKPRGNGETEPFALPDWIPPDAWEAWLKVRKRKRASNEPHALNLAVKTLDELRAAGNAPRAVLERSTLSGYTGLFEVPKPRPQRKEPDFPI